MEDRKEKSEEIVKSIKLLNSVLKTSTDNKQKERVKVEISKLRKMLQDLYPDSDVKELEDAISSDFMVIHRGNDVSLKDYKFLKDIEIEVVSAHKEDREINEIASLMRYYEERIWVAISEQHIKLDFSNSAERDVLYRKIDECNKAFKSFCQTIEDIEKSRSTEYVNQLHLMRVRHGRLFLFEIYYFFKSSMEFVSNLIASYELGGNMILNPDDIIEYADYERYRIFEDQTIIDILVYAQKFIDEVLDYINVPDIKKD